MKNVVLVCGIGLCMLSFGACKKCGHCELTVVATGTTVQSLQQCDTGDDYNNLKTACENNAVSGSVTAVWVED